jgi:hypothetical protein
MAERAKSVENTFLVRKSPQKMPDYLYLEDGIGGYCFTWLERQFSPPYSYPSYYFGSKYCGFGRKLAFPSGMVRFRAQ